MKTKQELRDKYFKECTYDFHGMKKVNMTAHNMFEWFWNNLQELSQPEDVKSVCCDHCKVTEVITNGYCNVCGGKQT